MGISTSPSLTVGLTLRPGQVARLRVVNMGAGTLKGWAVLPVDPPLETPTKMRFALRFGESAVLELDSGRRPALEIEPAGLEIRAAVTLATYPAMARVTCEILDGTRALVASLPAVEMAVTTPVAYPAGVVFPSGWEKTQAPPKEYGPPTAVHLPPGVLERTAT